MRQVTIINKYHHKSVTRWFQLEKDNPHNHQEYFYKLMDMADALCKEFGCECRHSPNWDGISIKIKDF